jgi:beta-galactosidase
MVLRDRNHPAVIMWSIGNEIPNRHKPEVVKVAKELADYVRQLEPTRSVSSAVNDLREDKDPCFATLDVGGYNYAADGDRAKRVCMRSIMLVFQIELCLAPSRIR